MIYRIHGWLVLCLGLSIAGAGAGCVVSDGDAPSLDGPLVSVRGAGTGPAPTGPAGTGPAGSASAGDLVASWVDAVQGVYGNGLSARALTRNALITNARANPVMVRVPLATESYADIGGEPELLFQLRHEPTREVMRYLASCALEPDQSLSYTDTSTGEKTTFPGEIGICPQWATGPAGAKCRQLITACLLSRVNAVGRNVTLSMRGQAFPEHRPGLLTPAPSVRAVTVTENSDVIPSFARCTTEVSGASRDCGWTAGHIGSCTPGSHVYLGVGGEPLGDCDADPSSAVGLSPGDTVVRVCSGIRGCDTSSPDHIEPGEARCSGRSEPALHFVCPASGHFSVMNGPRTSGPAAGAPGLGRVLGALVQQHKRFSVTSHPRPHPTPPPGAVSILEASFEDAEYPAPEARVFRWREGAFYGSFWGENPLNDLLTAGLNEVTKDGVFHGARASGQSVFRHAFACTGEYWTDQAAYVEHRLCAGAGEEKDCVAISVGACGDAHAFTDCPPLDQCSVADGGLVEGDGDFQECKGSLGGTWHHPITVYLNHPSDVIRDSPFARFVSGALFIDAPLCR
ncbi:hypothetical protein WME75_24145 [Sorangium sp. So ce1014]|uniref:hypothetical protein n=1 Tax=Sorangium sp. So ce1014 TaxID=3133326 RepID=UPI003F60BB85